MEQLKKAMIISVFNGQEDVTKESNISFKLFGNFHSSSIKMKIIKFLINTLPTPTSSYSEVKVTIAQKVDAFIESIKYQQ